MTVFLRPCGADGVDAAFVRACILESVTEELGAAAWPEPMRTHLLEIQSSSRLASMRSNYPEGASYIIQLDDRDAGWLFVAEEEGALHVVDVIVRTAFRRQGVASAALLDVIRRASAAGKKVRLQVNLSNVTAIRVYSRLRFQRTGGDEVQHYMEHSGELGG